MSESQHGADCAFVECTCFLGHLCSMGKSTTRLYVLCRMCWPVMNRAQHRWKLCSFFSTPLSLPSTKSRRPSPCWHQSSGKRKTEKVSNNGEFASVQFLPGSTYWTGLLVSRMASHFPSLGTSPWDFSSRLHPLSMKPFPLYSPSLQLA